MTEAVRTLLNRSTAWKKRRASWLIAARRSASRNTTRTMLRPSLGQRAGGSRGKTIQLDRVIHERVRLAILSALAGVDALTFNELKDLLDITDGNLSVHARRLEEAGFVACEKSFFERVPRTQYSLTAAGRVARSTTTSTTWNR